MQFESIRVVAAAVKNAILGGRKNWAVYYEKQAEVLHVSSPFKELPFRWVKLADVSEFLEEAETYCDNMPYCPPALEYLRGFAADDAPEFFVELLVELLVEQLEQHGGRVDDV